MNPNLMMQALQQSRQSNPVPPQENMPGMTPGVPGDFSDQMQKYWSMMQEMNSKLDKVIQAISGDMTGKNVKNDMDDGKNYGNEAKEYGKEYDKKEKLNERGSSGY